MPMVNNTRRISKEVFHQNEISSMEVEKEWLVSNAMLSKHPTKARIPTCTIGLLLFFSPLHTLPPPLICSRELRGIPKQI